MSPTEIAQALIVGLPADTFVAEVGGWLYEAAVTPPQGDLEFAIGPDLTVSLVSPVDNKETVVGVYKPRPIAPVATMRVEGKSPLPVEQFPDWLLDVLTDVARHACDKRLGEVAAQWCGITA